MKKLKAILMTALVAVNMVFPGGQALAQGNYCQVLSPPNPEQMTPSGAKLMELLKAGKNADQIVSEMLDPVAPLSEAQLQEIYNQVFEFIAKHYYEEARLANLAEFKHKYNGKLKTRSDLDKALAEMVRSMGDRWTWIVSAPDKMNQIMKFMAKQVNLGITLRLETDGRFVIEHVGFGSTAQLSGMREGDVVIAVRGKDLAGMTKEEADKLFDGPAGGVIKVKSIQDGKIVENDYILKMPLPHEAEAKMLENNIAYLKLPSFMSDEEFDKVVGSMLEMAHKTPGGLQAMVLDLRFNGGGEVNKAKNLVSLLIPHGVTINETSRDGRSVVETRTSILPLGEFSKLKYEEKDLAVLKELQSLPLVILINGSSASASEIVTGALKESRPNTVVLGEQSFGKFVEMIVMPLPNCSQIAVTSGRYTTPSGKWLQHAGITPDIIVHQPRDSNEDAQMMEAMKILKDKTGFNPANVVQMAPENTPTLGPVPDRPQPPEADTDYVQLAREHSTLIMQIGVGVLLAGLFGLYLFISRRRPEDKD